MEISAKMQSMIWRAVTPEERDRIRNMSHCLQALRCSISVSYTHLDVYKRQYRYKEAVKELIEENLEKTEARKYSFETELLSEEENTRKSCRLRRMIEICEEATDMLYKISREFDAIERRYNKLIEQKTVFASRAAARIRYIMMEGVMEEDQTRCV